MAVQHFRFYCKQFFGPPLNPCNATPTQYLYQRTPKVQGLLQHLLQRKESFPALARLSLSCKACGFCPPQWH